MGILGALVENGIIPYQWGCVSKEGSSFGRLNDILDELQQLFVWSPVIKFGISKNKSYLGIYSCSVAVWFWLSSREPSLGKCPPQTPSESHKEHDKFDASEKKSKETRDIAVSTSDIFTNVGKQVAWEDQKGLEKKDKENTPPSALELPSESCETSEDPIVGGSSIENRCGTQLETSEEQISSQTPPSELDTSEDPLIQPVEVCPHCGMFHTIRQHYRLFPMNNVGHTIVDDVVLPIVAKQQSYLKLSNTESNVGKIRSETTEKQANEKFPIARKSGPSVQKRGPSERSQPSKYRTLLKQLQLKRDTPVSVKRSPRVTFDSDKKKQTVKYLQDMRESKGIAKNQRSKPNL